MGNIKEADRLAGLMVFLHDALVLYRHGPTSEVDHPAMMFGMPLVKWRFEELIDRGHKYPFEIRLMHRVAGPVHDGSGPVAHLRFAGWPAGSLYVKEQPAF